MKRRPLAPVDDVAALQAARVDELLSPDPAAPELLHRLRLAVRDSEEQLHELIEQSSDGIFLADADGNYLLANSRLCGMLGATDAQLLATNVGASFPEMDGTDFSERLHRVQEERQMLFARLVKHSNGSCFPAEISLRALKNGTSQGIVRDVSVRGRERLLALEHSVAGIFAAADDRSAALIAVIRAVSEAENWEYGRYWCADEASGRITGADYWCSPNSAIEKFVADSKGSFERGTGLPGRVWESGRPIWVADIRGDPRIGGANFSAKTGMRSCCVYPIATEGDTLGVFVFMSHQLREPDGRMLATADAIASQAARFLRRKNADAAQRASEARFLGAFEQAPIGVALESLEGRFFKVNQAMCQLLGYTEAELTGKNFQEITHPDDLARDLQSIVDLVAGKTRDYHAEKRYFHKNGQVIWVQLGVSMIRDAQDRPEHFIAHVQDISEQKRIEAELRHQISERVKSEEALRHSGAMFQDIFNSAPVPLAVTDKRARFVHVNPAFTETFGYTLEDIPCLRDWWQRAYPDAEYRRLVISNWRDRATDRDDGGGAVPPRERRIRCKNGEQRIAMVGDASLGTSPEGTRLVFFYDITERKQAEHVVREYASQQNLIAEFGQQALANTDLDELLDQLATLVAAGLHVDFCKVLQFGPDGHSLLHKAGVGWGDGWIGGLVPPSDETTRADFVLASREPLTVADFFTETRFAPSATLALHNISSGVDVPILGSDGPLGIIGAYSRQPRNFTPENVSFLQSLANTVGTAMDRKALEQRFAYLAQFDSLTGLPNRGLLLDRFSQTLTQAARNDWIVGILFVDLDRFKVVNDTRGHSVGDALLVEVAARLRDCVRAGDTVGRLGGDEFAIVLCSLDKPADAGLVSEKLVNALSQPFPLQGQEIYVSASLGIAIYPNDGTQADELLKNADTAMYRAKERGRNTFQFYLPDMNLRSTERLALETQLRGALERQEFLLHYQPKANIASGSISGFEALLRWQHPLRGLVGPDLFISILEDTGMIVPVGEWVLRTVCTQLTRWKAAGITPRPVAVNLSARQFQQRNLDSVISTILAETEVDADLLELELTESMLMRDPEEAVHTLEALRGYGVALAVDDFGTGYSSLSYLQRFPLDALKIDRAFIRDVTTKADDANIAVAIITLAHSLKLKVIAEGVETKAQLDFLKSHGCDEMQGYYFSPALDIENCTRALIDDRRLP